ncbi:hypothetical protein CEXT_232561 [Caerostris extrusa]|uniref:Uncharacterized protein n=1 Tax=Caerostris extrusa TaxID=172846 RepID=A0AAV4X8Z0_CAEEX|nr:hypothetical protein CEXT_232561 [Caerostris extrusa]
MRLSGPLETQMKSSDDDESWQTISCSRFFFSPPSLASPTRIVISCASDSAELSSGVNELSAREGFSCDGCLILLPHSLMGPQCFAGFVVIKLVDFIMVFTPVKVVRDSLGEAFNRRYNTDLAQKISNVLSCGLTATAANTVVLRSVSLLECPGTMAAPRRSLVHSNHVTISSETEYRRWVLFPNLDLCLYAAVQGQANVRSHCVSTFPNALSSELFSTNSLASLDRRVTSGYMETFVQITVQH